ncbi:MAG: hypothetical protein ACREE4_21480 [Stellaceae bacterium]
MNEFSFDPSKYYLEGESYSISYDEIIKNAIVHVHGIRYDLVGPYENYAAAMQAAWDLLRQKGLKP